MTSAGAGTPANAATPADAASPADGEPCASWTRTAELAWVPTGPGSAFRPLRFWEGGWSELMRLEPGTEVAQHRHTGPVDAYVLEGTRLLSSGERLGPGGFQHEPAGTVDTWSATGSEPCVVHLRIDGDIEYLDPGGAVTSVVNSATQSAVFRRWCEATYTAEERGDEPMRSITRAIEPEDVTRLVAERLNAGDAAGAAALYEPDAVLAYPVDRPVTGRAAIEAVYQALVEAGVRFGAEAAVPTVRFEDLALTSTRSADGTGVRVQVLRRQPDGSWLRVIDRPEVPGSP